ncbi:dihydrofolate reductase family protein [Demequina pelophila]|uniref:dihydrofolate reductase family protein n=1 Tax=Demequina pelophila TaxID=1638984 RepID=UPI000781B251|nr:dihydrofolate reductase family protein [Demequina pelophila]
MGRLIFAMNASLDGYVCDERGGFAWSEPSEEVHTYFNGLTARTGTLLYGRRIYEVMAVWETLGDEPDAPPVVREFADAWRRADKIVYSTTLTAPAAANTWLARAFDPEQIRELKDFGEHDIGIAGPTLAAHALRAGLVDEVQVMTLPVLVGGGTRMFPDRLRLDLDLLETRVFDTGAMLVRYQVKGGREG